MIINVLSEVSRKTVGMTHLVHEMEGYSMQSHHDRVCIIQIVTILIMELSMTLGIGDRKDQISSEMYYQCV